MDSPITKKKKKKVYNLDEMHSRFVSSESYHWICWIADTCSNLDVSSDNFY